MHLLLLLMLVSAIRIVVAVARFILAVVVAAGLEGEAVGLVAAAGLVDPVATVLVRDQTRVLG